MLIVNLFLSIFLTYDMFVFHIQFAKYTDPFLAILSILKAMHIFFFSHKSANFQAKFPTPKTLLQRTHFARNNCFCCRERGESDREKKVKKEKKSRSRSKDRSRSPKHKKSKKDRKERSDKEKDRDRENRDTPTKVKEEPKDKE